MAPAETDTVGPPRAGRLVARLLRTTAVRMALRYALWYALVLGTALAAVWFTTRESADRALLDALARDFAAIATRFDEGGAAALAEEVAARAGTGADRGEFLLLVDAQGEKVAGNLLRWPRESDVPTEGELELLWIEDNAIPVPVEDDEVLWPVIGTRFPDGHRLLVARRVPQAGALHDLAEYLLEMLGAAVVLAVLMSVTLGHAILRRMDTIARTAGDIVTGDLSRRVPVGTSNDEFDALARQLNAMLERMQRLIQGMREVTDNVAHDLRSPLSRLRNRFEVLLLDRRSPEEYEDALRRAVEDVNALLGTFNTLLSVAQMESGQLGAEWTPMDLGEVARDLSELYAPLMQERGLSFEVAVDDGGRVRGSRDLLGRAASNLLENALKFTPAGGRVRLDVALRGDVVELAIADTGPGIPAAERAHVLERFVRLDASRNTPGAGLGLPLVRGIARLHGAELSLDDADPGRVPPGLRVTLCFARV